MGVGQEIKSCCLVNVEFPFCKMTKFWGSVAQQGGYTLFEYTLLHCTVKMIQVANFMCFLTTVKNFKLQRRKERRERGREEMRKEGIKGKENRRAKRSCAP